MDTNLIPLAARLRPLSLNEFVGQAQLIGPGAPLRRLLESGHLPSLLLWGPPGSGKTTLANLLAKASHAHFENLSAVSTGVPELRRIFERAAEDLTAGQRTIVFLDEIHRFNKAQQDALLPHVENGTIILIGATTETPFKMVIPALLSRLQLLRLEPLSHDDLNLLLNAACEDARGYAGRVSLDEAARRALIGYAAGDARRMLTLLETAVGMTGLPGDGSSLAVSAPEVALAAQSATLDFDASGVLSALIKSIRGSDPDAALWWLATLLEAGTDPRVVARRLVISASEDVGNTDPRGLWTAVAALSATEHIGMPEVQYNLAQATVLLASLPKSNAAGLAYFAALDTLRAGGSRPVPGHLRAAAKTYRNPHLQPEAENDQVHLPAALAEQVWYRPSGRGIEGELAPRLERLRAKRAERRRAAARRG